MKYKELPAFISICGFHIGDQVRVFADTFWERRVVKTLGNYLVLDDGEHVHFKACRKLVEDKPREFWVQLNDRGDALYIDRERRVADDDSKRPLILVREVKE